ncbi:hypothetical protein AMS68_003951 [Peltaster fructicola]|uniref:Uncharacterized protein n=1 Tax=Peltaster fructicola TaxID=286661 RepID=A0A6H0XUM6_9PEZI|nr:hypothetical protein AMS68_003951 [Peltaster fructicola]
MSQSASRRNAPQSARHAKDQSAQQDSLQNQASSLADNDKVRQESSKIAQKALAAQDKAAQLMRAAIAAGDPQERQKLLNQALQAEIEAESFGKTAKWLSSGSFQGFLAGSGIGSVPGMTLGALTGTLVGGVTTLVTGGLGGAIGAGVGAIHGPFIKLGDVVGGALNKCLPTIPGWEATDQQKYALEKSLGQIKEQDQPSSEDLQKLTESSGEQQSDMAGSGDAAQYKNDASLQTGSGESSRRIAYGDSAQARKQGPPQQNRKNKPRKLEVRSTRTESA